jgi:LL-diaminopimelate aminotransferase
LIDHYLENARLLATALQKTGLSAYGGINAPYIWVKAPPRYGSWAVFDKLLKDIQVVITPGAGFGAQGEGFFRVSAFNSRENAKAVAERFQHVRW